FLGALLKIGAKLLPSVVGLFKKKQQ
uniref:M-poneritoxin-Na1b n=1 Tax=Neoponera apicalis TaxID=2320211 RepID=WTX1B_NEOAP|nr:RecName: Full=M-poneritoxin-Na1b; Short=M-PONTX-Na1b; AltName: Full=Poneratoxin; AltName: Full=Ponericin Pa II2; AltName: Full=U1-poneritoxin-Na1b; Short=U1-PONTX-Na1b [Neoponera apicalis]